jgi:DNA-binding MarR family transcriptional regulator
MSADEEISFIVEKFWESIPPAWHRTRAVIRGAAATKAHLTVEQFQVLRRIRKGSTSVSKLADVSQTSRSAVSKAVDALVNHGLVSRSQNADDRRNIPLALTLEGERLLSMIYQDAEAWLSGRFTRLTARERRILIEGMDVLQKAFAQD